ncbi:MAG: hypothetical protein V7672_11790 [Brevundimonas sp.]|uniref:hypothetical protein n=1 Tax=Brevundimonas sp. TaxID=1871086 RepID=UPI003001786E
MSVRITATTGAMPVTPAPEASQRSSAIASLPDGGYLILLSDDRVGNGLLVQRFDALGHRSGDPISIGQWSAGYSHFHDFIVTSDSKLVLFVRGSDGIEYQVFSLEGEPLTNRLLANSALEGTESNPTVTVLADGGWLLTWQEGDGSGQGVFGRLFESSGNPRGDDFPINSLTQDNQTLASVAALPDGGFVVAWRTTDGVPRVLARQYDADGQPHGPESAVNSFGDDPHVAHLDDGGYVITYLAGTVHARFYDDTGQPLGAGFEISSGPSGYFWHATASLDTGGFVVVWSRDNPSTGAAIEAQAFDASGAPTGPPIEIVGPGTLIHSTPELDVMGLARVDGALAPVAQGCDGPRRLEDAGVCSPVFSRTTSRGLLAARGHGCRARAPLRQGRDAPIGRQAAEAPASAKASAA